MSIRRAAAALLLAGLLMAATVSAAIWHPGKWTVASQVHLVSGTAVNMMLLPGTDPLDPVRSQVLWWADDHDLDNHAPPDSNTGGRFDWLPSSDALLNAGEFPNTGVGGAFAETSLAATGFNIFCSGLTSLSSGDGFVVGGTTEAENGESRAAIYNHVTKAWTVLPGQMQTGRWYPSATALADGRVLVTSGSQYRHLWLFGGAAGDVQLRRLPVSHVASWESAVSPMYDPGAQVATPVARRGHTATWSLGSRQAIFGGQEIGGTEDLRNDLWLLTRDDNQRQSDYRYLWHQRALAAGSPQPSKRAFHAAVSPSDAALIIFGGMQNSPTTHLPEAASDVWKAELVPLSWEVTWRRLKPSGASASFPPRYGHAAFWHKNNACAYVFGGSGDPAGMPSDGAVYRMKLVGADSVEWTICTIENSADGPAPRMSMATGVINMRPTAAEPEMNGLVLYGGRTSSGAVSDSLFVLWPTGPTAVRWQRVAQSGARPPALENSAAAATENSAEFWIVGGKTAADTATATSATYSFSTHVASGAGANSLVANWTVRDPAPHKVWGHTFPVHNVELFVRVPEVWDPIGQQFERLTSAPLLQDWYPQMFTVPGTKGVQFVGPDMRDNRMLTVTGPTSAWGGRILPDSVAGIRGGSSVMYRPGKVMKCGSRDTDGNGDATGITRVLDLTAAQPAWVGSTSMLPRVNHNLVIMPDGKVIVVGGTGHVTNGENTNPQRTPEIWDPSANNGTGAWEGAGLLEASTVLRGYHSSALLLPDGRILCAGGNATTSSSLLNSGYHNDQHKMDIYSPPYLFSPSGGVAPRPTIVSAPRQAAYGQRFVLTAGGNGLPARITILRPGAVTHGYDASQRFVELTFDSHLLASGERIYHVTLPADSAVAPPGDYMMFVLNEAGTPSIARWIRINRLSDETAVPSAITNLAKACSDGETVDLQWTPPAAEPAASILAPAARYELRYRTSSMPDTATFRLGSHVVGTPAPGDPLGGSPDRVVGFPVTAGTTYYFRIRSRNSASTDGPWSNLSNQLTFTAHNEDCGGAGGGGGGFYEGDFSAGRSTGRTSLRRPGGGVAADSNFIENTLLPVVRFGVTATDRIRLPFGPRWVGNRARIRLSRAGSISTHFDRVQLVAVDHVAGEETFVLAGEVVAGTTSDPVRVMHADGRDLTEALASGVGFDGRDGDTLYAEFAQQGPATVVVSSSRSHLVRFPDVTGIQLATETAAGWESIGHHEPRRLVSDEAFVAPSIRRVRLVFMGVHRLEGVAQLIAGSNVDLHRYEPLAVQHSRYGDVTALLQRGDGVTLGGGDYAYADFAYSAAPGDTAREWYLEVAGAHQEGGGGAASTHLGRDGTAPSARVALAPNTPNPFRGSTTLAFELAVRTIVKLEIFDVLGRRVAIPCHGAYAAGRHTLEWDGRSSGGQVLPAGVFLCRMTAGNFRAEQHLVLVR